MDSIETRFAVLEEQVRQLQAAVSGDGRQAWERSIMGRLNRVERAMDAADHFAEAARELRRAESRKWSRREKVWLFVFAGMAGVGGLAGGIAAAVALLA